MESRQATRGKGHDVFGRSVSRRYRRLDDEDLS